MKKNHFYIFIPVGLVIVFGVLLGLKVATMQDGEDQVSADTRQQIPHDEPRPDNISEDDNGLFDLFVPEISTFPPCDESNTLLTVSPVDLDDFMGLVPLGNVAPSGHVFPTDHIYFHINRIDKSQWDLGTVEVPVYSPGNVTVTEIRQTHHTDDSGLTDYDIRFTLCDEVEAFFIHLVSLSGELLEAFKPPYDNCYDNATGNVVYEQCTKYMEVEIMAGEQIGTAGGGPGKNALDLGVIDHRKEPTVYANIDRWFEDTPFISCPLDYFSSDVAAELDARLGSHDGGTLRTIEPRCGTIVQDIPGTVQGAWFLGGTPLDTMYSFPEDPHLALIHDNVDPSIGVFSIGRSLEARGITSDIYQFDPLGTGFVNTDFPNVIPGEIYCYETRERFGTAIPFTILLQMTNANSITVGRMDSPTCGPGPWVLEGGVEFER